MSAPPLRSDRWLDKPVGGTYWKTGGNGKCTRQMSCISHFSLSSKQISKLTSPVSGIQTYLPCWRIFDVLWWRVKPCDGGVFYRSRSEKRTTQRANLRARDTAAITFTVRRKCNRNKVAVSLVLHSPGMGSQIWCTLHTNVCFKVQTHKSPYNILISRWGLLLLLLLLPSPITTTTIIAH